MNLIEMYKLFLRYRISNKYFNNYKYLKVLGDNFIDKYYIALIEFNEGYIVDKENLNVGIIVENIKTPLFIQLNPKPHREGYVTISKKELSSKLPSKLYKKLVKQGLATTEEIGNRLNKRCCWHRLVTCLYYDCLGKEVHHMDKNVRNNNITNLIPVSKSEHALLDSDEKNGLNLSKNVKFRLKKRLKKKRNTLVSNDRIIKEIIREKHILNFNIKQIIGSFNNKIKKSSVYKIISLFFYAKEFIKTFQNQSDYIFQELYGNYNEQWKHIITFERLE